MSPWTIILYPTATQAERVGRGIKDGKNSRASGHHNSYEPVGAVFAGAHGNYAKLRGGCKRSLAPKGESYVEFEAFVCAVRARCGVVARSIAVRFSGGSDDFRIFVVSNSDPTA